MADLVVCCDGTWNTPDDLDGGLPAPTNVFKIFNALAATNAAGDSITGYYHPGVATNGTWWDRVLGGGLGTGLSGNIKSAYRWLAGACRPGDRIWLFGFSRGAFTARSLSGAISRCGLLDPAGMKDKEIWAAVDAIYADYRARKDVTASKARPLHNVKNGGPAKGSAAIYFIGAWDTVGALGIPDDMALLNLIDDPTTYEFHDTALSANVVHARHAMALDERRQSFTPTLWVDLPPKQDVKQAWFPGVHSDVGGGYSRCGLSDGALKWMMDEATGAGLTFRTGAAAQVQPNAGDVLHDLLTGVFKSLKTRPREAPRFHSAGARTDDIHPSAYARYDDPPLTQAAYWPTRELKTNVPTTVEIYARPHWNATGLYLEKNATYVLKAEGEWLDKSTVCGPKGADDGKFDRGDVMRSVASGLGGLQKLYERFTDNAEADFWWTKREEDIGWFALTGMIASGEWFDKNGALTPRPLKREGHLSLRLNETVAIGDGVTFKPKASGYLYCFANDAWQAYDNNRGSVRLTVTRR